MSTAQERRLVALEEAAGIRWGGHEAIVMFGYVRVASDANSFQLEETDRIACVAIPHVQKHIQISRSDGEDFETFARRARDVARRRATAVRVLTGDEVVSIAGKIIADL